MELTAAQGRVLGALVEKERTTPQGYPLTDNALLAACNQTTSRDPVVSYDITTVRMAVRELRQLGLVRTVHRTGERSDKHRHELETALGLSAPQVSLLAVLLLRGPQTLAELRSRTERLHVFATVDDVEQALAAMADRDEPLVGLLPRQPGRKEARFGQLLAGGSAGGPVRAATDGGPGPASGSDPQSSWRSDQSPGGTGDGPRSAPDQPGGGATHPSDQGDDRADQDGDIAVQQGDGRSVHQDEDRHAGGETSGDQSGLAVAVADLVEQVAELRSEVQELRAALERATGG